MDTPELNVQPAEKDFRPPNWPKAFPYPSYAELSKVLPNTTIFRVRVNSQNLLREIEEEGAFLPRINDPILGPIWGQLDLTSKAVHADFSANLHTLVQPLEKAFQNDRFLELLAHPPPEGINQKLLQQYLDINDSEILHRLDCILNFNTDPELVVLELHRWRQEKSIPAWAVEAFAQDKTLQRSYIIFVNSQREANPKKDFSEQAKEGINLLVESWIQTIALLQPSLNLQETENTLKQFFTVKRLFMRTNSRFLTFRLFQQLVPDFWQKFHWHNLDVPETESLAEQLGKKVIQQVETWRYLTSLKQKVEQTFDRFFPALAVKPVIKELAFVYSPHSSRGEWLPEQKAIYLITSQRSKDFPGKGITLFDQETINPAGIPGKRKIIDFLTIAHEYSHAVFDQIVFDRRGISQEGRWPQDSQLAHPITEGFAVLVETLLIDVMKTHPKGFDLEQADLADIDNWKKGRAQNLRLAKNGYTEGFAHLMWHIYLAGARTEQGITPELGIKAVRNFLDQIDGNKILDTFRDDQAYQKLLQTKKHSWNDWQQFILGMEKLLFE